MHKQKCGRKMSRMLSSEKAGGGAKNELSNCSSLLWNRDPITGHSVLIIIIFIQAFYLFSSFDRDLLYSFFLRFKSFIPALCLSFPSCSRNFSGGKKKKNWGPMHSALKNSMSPGVPWFSFLLCRAQFNRQTVRLKKVGLGEGEGQNREHFVRLQVLELDPKSVCQEGQSSCPIVQMKFTHRQL